MAARIHSPETVQILLDCWRYQQQHADLRLCGYEVLENYLHFIAQADDLNKCVSSFKSYTARPRGVLLRQNRLPTYCRLPRHYHPSIAKRLLVARQACVLVWQFQYDNTPQATEIKHFLVRLSGRQMKKNHPITPSALLEGLWLFLTLMDTLDHYPLDQLRQFKQFVDTFWSGEEVV